MLRITADIFSGRPNPTWIVTDDAVAERVIAAVHDNAALAATEAPVARGLGLRGIEVQVISDDDEVRAGRVPTSFMLAASPGAASKPSIDLATYLVKDMARWSDIVLPEHALTPLSPKIRDVVLEQLEKFAKARSAKAKGRTARLAQARRRTTDDPRTRCQYEISLFNPDFWNANPDVRRRNNCYNYARNWRTDTFAQPGRASGHPTSTMSCPAVSTAARHDGLVDRGKCLPQSEYPRRLMALVIWPGVDYHWYRHHIGGFWGHKPGQTAARNTDNSNVVIANPQTCNRGNYTHFCGYFYAGKSVCIA